MTATPEQAQRSWALVERAQGGDIDAFGQLYDLYFDQVYLFVWGLSNKNRLLAEDITADTFLHALRKIDSFTWQGRDFGCWLNTIARNRLTDFFKSGRNRYEMLHSGGGDQRDEPEVATSPRDCPEEIVLRHQDSVRVLSALTQLTGEQRRVIELRFLHQFSTRETAAIMGKPYASISSMQFRALQAMRRALQGLEPVAGPPRPYPQDALPPPPKLAPATRSGERSRATV